jgi:hypothetical protein
MNRGALLLSILDAYSNGFAASLEGKARYVSRPMVYSQALPRSTTTTITTDFPVPRTLRRDESNDHVRGGARIRHIFVNVFNPALDDLDPASELSDDEIRTAIKNAGGITGSLLIPEAPFELLVSRAIERLLRPALQCREFVHQELVHIAAQSVPSEVSRFPRLRSRMMDAVEEFISLGASPAEVRHGSLV